MELLFWVSVYNVWLIWYLLINLEMFFWCIWLIVVDICFVGILSLCDSLDKVSLGFK